MATMKKKSKSGNKDVVMKRREEGFDLNSIPHAKLTEYSALHDPNMRHYFENPNVQRLLYESGQIDRHGRVINMEKNKSKLKILEREFRDAERMEERRLKEEMEMRYRVQRKRFQQLEDAQRQDVMIRLKADRDLSKEILGTIRSTARTTHSARSTLSRSAKAKTVKQRID